MAQETFAAHHYVIREQKQSVIDPSVTHEIEVGITCPRCKTRLPMLDHWESQRCKECNLHMQLHGNALTCTI
jgi:hypothetical protein